MQVPEEPGYVPNGFLGYLRMMGPGIVAVLTWFGAGDVVAAGVAGGNYGYTLMWSVVVAAWMRYVLVSQIAKFHLCNPRGDGVVDGLVRLHPAYAPFLFVAAVIMGHVYGAYMLVGVGEASVQLTGVGAVWHWAMIWSAVGAYLTLWGFYRRVEIVFMVLLALLGITIVGTAFWVGPSFSGILAGTIGFRLPETHGPFSALLIVVSMTGAVGGSLMSLVYPYFMDQKGWSGPAYRKLQEYDLRLSVFVMVVLNLAIWTLGAELIHRRGDSVSDLNGLTELLGRTLGEAGRKVFILGVFAAVYTSLVGVAMGLGFIGSHCWQRWKNVAAIGDRQYRRHPMYRWMVAWILFSPLIWTHSALANFVALTLIGNATQMLILPVLACGLWRITASRRFIGDGMQTRWHHPVMAVLVALSLWGSWGAMRSIYSSLRGLLSG